MLCARTGLSDPAGSCRTVARTSSARFKLVTDGQDAGAYSYTPVAYRLVDHGLRFTHGPVAAGANMWPEEFWARAPGTFKEAILIHRRRQEFVPMRTETHGGHPSEGLYPRHPRTTAEPVALTASTGTDVRMYLGLNIFSTFFELIL